MGPLHHAILDSNEQAVRELIIQGADVNCLSSFGESPLGVALRLGNLKIFKLLLSGSAAIKSGDKCLHTIIQEGKLAFLKIILECSSNVSSSAMSEIFCSAIHLDNSDLVQLLLNKNVDPNVVLRCGYTSWTPLQLACLNGFEDLAKTLIEHGAEVNMKVKNEVARSNNEQDQVPLYLAILNGHIRTVRLLLKSGADVNIRNPINRTMLHAAVSMGNAELSDIGFSHINRNNELENKLEIIHSIIDYGCEINIQDIDRNSPLHLAVKHLFDASHSFIGSSVDIIKLLLNSGASVNAQDKYGNTALHFVASKMFSEITSVLSKYDADPNVQNEWGDTPLHKACRCQCRKNISLLISIQGDPNIQNKAGRTPLIEAIDGCSETVISTLLNAGGNTSIQDQNGDTALHYAVMNSNNTRESKIMISILLKHGSNPNSQNNAGDTPLHKACERSLVEITILILDYGGNPNIQNNNGYTAFHNAVESFIDMYSSGILSTILSKGGDPNLKNKQGNTPLHKACMSEIEDCVRVILENGGDPNVQNEDGKTPLHDAIESNNCCEVLIPLLDNGGNPNICDEQGDTSLHLACKMRCKNCIRSILNSGGNPNAQNSKGDTPMHNLDVSYDSGGILYDLLDYGADVNIQNKIGSNPLNNHRTLTIFSRFMALRKCANFYVDPKLFQIANLQANMKEFYDVGEEELQTLKRETIGNTKITYYLILKETSHRLIKLLRNRNIVDVMETEEHLIKFPYYGDMISSNYRRALRRNELIEQVLEISSEILFSQPNLPFNCIEHILSFLGDDELKKLFLCLKLSGQKFASE